MSQTQVPEFARKAPASTGRVAILLFLFLNCIFLLTSTGRVRTIDEIDPVLQSESLLLRHSTAIPQAAQSGIYFGKLDVHGIPRSAWPVGHSLLVLPWAAFGHHIFSHLPGFPETMADLAISTALCWSNATYAALGVAAAFALFMGLGVERRRALLCCAVLAFATPLFVYSGWLYSEPVTIALLLLAALLLFAEERPARMRVVGAALLLAASIHVRPANVVMVAIFVAAVAVQEFSAEEGGFRYRATSVLLAASIVAGVLYLVRNQMLFGSPMDFGVPATAEGGKDLDSWHNPLGVGLFGFLLSPGKSVILFCPPIVLGLAGLGRMWQKRRGLAVVCGLAPVVNLFFYSLRTQWEAGYCWGPRYLVPSLILGTLPLVLLLQEPPQWLRPALWVAGVAGLAVQAIGLATNVLEDMVHNHYFVGNWDYRMSYSPISGQLALIWKYLHQAPAALGLGWDRWFVFLRAAGASAVTIDVFVAMFAVGAAGFGMLLWRESR